MGFFEKAHADEFSWFLAPDGETALSILDKERLDLIILDWTLPGLGGPAILKALRALPKTRSLGVLMVTARSSADDTVTALETGADDFLSKPFDERVLLARLHSLLRRKQSTWAASKVYRLPGLYLDVDANLLCIENRRVHLNPKETDIFMAFLARPNMIHSASFLWDVVWGYESDSWERNVIALISNLRKKLGPTWGARLEVHRKRGYILNIP